LKPKSKLFYSYLLFLLIYAAFVLIPAPLPATLALYHISATGLRLIDVTIIVLVAAIWYAGFYGYAKLQAYSKLIEGNKDGAEVAKITRGLFLLVTWLPVSSVVSVVLKYYGQRHIEWLPAATIISNYVNLLLPLVGFVFIGLGASGLARQVKQRPSYRAINFMIILLIYVSLIYYRLVATTSHRASVYHMSIWFILSTLVAPYIYMWAVGIFAAYNINLYRQKVAGIIYRRSWGYLAMGLGWLIVTSIIFQYLTTLTARLTHLSIYWLLAIVYILLLVLSAGFVLVAIGARKLKKIEEV
jgi:hypothetical protein